MTDAGDDRAEAARFQRHGLAVLRHCAAGDLAAVDELMAGVDLSDGFTSVAVTGVQFASVVARLGGRDVVVMLDEMLRALAAEPS